MMELQVMTPGGDKVNQISVSGSVFAQEFNEHIIHSAVVKDQAALRQGTHKQLTRSEVSGGGKKPWRQKGTGRARAGTTRGPIWRSGGRAFAARPGSYKQKMNKKAYRAALCSILSELLRQERLHVIDNLTLDTHKTKELLAKMQQLKLDNVLIVISDDDKNLQLAARNIPRINVIKAADVGPVELVGAHNVLLTVDSVKHFEERLGS